MDSGIKEVAKKLNKSGISRDNWKAVSDTEIESVDYDNNVDVIKIKKQI